MLELAPYQSEAADRMVCEGRFLLADEPGVGKTITAIAAAARLPGPRLVVCPAHLQAQWVEVLRGQGHEAMKLAGSRAEKAVELARYASGATDHIWLVTSYTLLGARDGKGKAKAPRYPILSDPDGPWNVVIFDEAHALRSPKSATTKAAHELCKNYDRSVFLLTGTPEVTNSGDWYSYALILGQLNHRSYWRFIERHCQVQWTPFGKDIRGLQNPGTFHGEVLGEKYMRRKLTEIGLDLSKPRVVVEWLEMTKQQIRAHNKAKQDFRTHDDQPMAGAGEVCHYLRQFTTLPPWAPHDKLDYLQAKAQDHYLEKMVVLTWYRKSRDAVAAKIKHRPVFTIKADDPKDYQRELIDAWAATDNGVLVGTLPHLKEGVDGLQVARVMVLLEKSYLASENEQAIGRLFRRGQSQAVLVYTPVVKGTIDAAVHKASEQRKDWALKDLLEMESSAL